MRNHLSSSPFSPIADRPWVDPEEDVGEVVRVNLLRLMQEHGLSLGSLAERANVTRAVLEDLVIGQSFPTVELLWKLARALDVPCTIFIGARR